MIFMLVVMVQGLKADSTFAGQVTSVGTISAVAALPGKGERIKHRDGVTVTYKTCSVAYFLYYYCRLSVLACLSVLFLQVSVETRGKRVVKGGRGGDEVVAY